MSLEYKIDHRGVAQLQTGQKRGYCWPVLLTLLILLLLASIWLFFSGYLTPAGATGGLQALSLRGKMDEQARMLDRQSEQILQLESQAAAAIRSRDVEVSANEVLRRKLSVAETDLAEARGRLLLYEDILSPKALDQGLNITHFAIKARVIDEEGNKLEPDRYYQYHLVLANVRGGETVASGQFELTLSGQQDNKPVTLKLDQLSSGATGNTRKASSNTFSLKYYQSIEGQIELPKSFIPVQAVVVLHPAAEGSLAVTKTYDWASFRLPRNPLQVKE